MEVGLALTPFADRLRGLPISLDESQASLQGPNPRVHYEACADGNAVGYADRNGFEGYSLQFADETKGLVELEALAERGNELSSIVYTYRSVAKALPTATGDDANKKKMYSASFEVRARLATPGLREGSQRRTHHALRHAARGLR